MPASTRAIALSLALLLALPLALGQANGALSVSLAPTHVTFAPGANATTTVTVSTTGLQPVTVHLSARNATGDLNISFTNGADINVAPGVPGTATALVSGTLEGAWQVTILATQSGGGGVGGNATAGQAVLNVTIAPPPANTTGNSTDPPAPVSGGGSNNTSPPTNGTSPTNTTGTNRTSPSNTTTTNATNSSPTNTTPPANATDQTGAPPPETLPVPFTVDPRDLSIAVDRGVSAPFHVTLSDPRVTPTGVTLTLHLPLGWGGALDAAAVTIPAQGSVDAGGSVRPGSTARDANATLDITNGSLTETVHLALRVLDPIVTDTSQGGIAANGTAHQTPPDITPQPPARPPPSIHAEPADVGGPPGVTVLVTIVVTNPGPTPISGTAAISVPPFLARTDDPSFSVPSGGEQAITFNVKIDSTATPGSNYSGLASTSLEAIAPAAFHVHVDSADAPAKVPAAVVAQGDDRIVLAAAALAVGAGALALVALARRWPGLGLFPLYARLAPRRALEHPRRAHMLELLRAEPGLTLADVQKRLGLSNGVARHHVALLEAAGVVRSVPDGSRRRLWPMDSPRVAATPGLGDRALAAIRARGQVRASELASELGVSRQSLHYHLKRLEAEGKIVTQRAEGELVLRVSAEA